MIYNFLTLSFNKDWKNLEPAFIKSYFKESIIRLRFFLLISIFFYSIFGILDSVVAPEKRHIFWTIRYIVFCPAAVYVIWFSFRPNFEKHAQTCLFLLSLLAGFGVELMVLLASPSEAYSYYA